jgi:hypothetical protein
MHDVHDDEIDAFRARRRRKLGIAIAMAVATLVAVALAGLWLTPRRVIIAGPTGGTITVAHEKPARFPERVGMVVELAPGTYPIESEDQGVRSEVHVPVWSRTVVQPARSDQCLIVASAAGAYAFDGENPSGDAFSIVERCAPEYAPVALVVANVYTDPCMLPFRKHLMDDAYVAYAVPVAGAPVDDEDAQLLLVAALLSCG